MNVPNVREYCSRVPGREGRAKRQVKGAKIEVCTNLETSMPKRTKEPLAYSRVNNHQKATTLRLIPVINQKNYFTNYLKKDSQYLCRKIRDRGEDDDTQVVVLQLGSRNLRIGFSSDAVPKCLPFNVAKKQKLYDLSPSEKEVNESLENESAKEERFEDALNDITQSFVDRMKFYKTRITHNAKDICQQFNARQKGEAVNFTSDDEQSEEEANPKEQGLHPKSKYFCVPKVIPDHNTFWPIHRGVLNEDPRFYRSSQELLSDISDILSYASTSKQGLGITDLKNSSKYDLVLVVPDLQERLALAEIVSILFELGYANIAIIEEAVAATYGAGISAACVVDIGAQTTKVSCIDEGACLSNSRVKLDFGGDDVTKVFGQLLERVSFPGNPDFYMLDKLKQKFCTVNEADISVQLYQYINRADRRKYDFKVYNEVMLPVFSLFYPGIFTFPSRVPFRNALFPHSTDPYTGHSSEPISDADINIRMGTLSVMGQSYIDVSLDAGIGGDDGDGSMLDVDEGDADPDVSREGTPSASLALKQDDKSSKEDSEALSQLKAFESLDLAKPALAALDHAIVESIAQASKQSATPKQFYENILVIGGGSQVPSFHAMLTDRLVMWNQTRLKEIGEVAVMAMPRDMDAESMCWKGGSVYSKLKIVDEMWTTRDEWNTLGSRTLHYKAALYML